MLIIAGADELADSRASVWGSGGWDPPEARRARDWWCLAHLCGWTAAVSDDVDAPATQFVIWAAPAPPDAGHVDRLAARLQRERLLIVGVAGDPGSPWAALTGVALAAPLHGRDVVNGTRAWRTAQPVAAHGLAVVDAAPLALLDGRVVAAVRDVGRGRVLTLGFDPSAARDADGSFSALLRALLVDHAPGPVGWLDWSGTLVLRMDDPGSCESAYREGWRYPKLDADAWDLIAADLRRRGARLTAAYVPAFVDDGDPTRGFLEVAGRPAQRARGAVHPSRAVRYRAHGQTWDGVSEHAGLLAQHAAGTLDIQLHGHTHMRPEREAWALADDRYAAERWYREMVPEAERNGDHPIDRGLAEIGTAFGVAPSTLVCPGDAWTTATLERALDAGLELVSSYSLALRDGARWIWCQHVCAPYLDTPEASWFHSGLPVVGYFHDMEPSVHGVDWLTAQLDAWEAAGARRMIALGDLAAALRHPREP